MKVFVWSLRSVLVKYTPLFGIAVDAVQLSLASFPQLFPLKVTAVGRIQD